MLGRLLDDSAAASSGAAPGAARVDPAVAQVTIVFPCSRKAHKVDPFAKVAAEAVRTAVATLALGAASSQAPSTDDEDLTSAEPGAEATAEVRVRSLAVANASRVVAVLAPGASSTFAPQAHKVCAPAPFTA